MKKSLILLAVSLIVATLIAIAYWPQRVQIVLNKGQSTDGLYVVLLRRSEWERFPVEANGRVTIGRGIRNNTPMALCVVDRQHMYWEGPVYPKLFEKTEIRLIPGRDLSTREAGSLLPLINAGGEPGVEPRPH